MLFSLNPVLGNSTTDSLSFALFSVEI